MSNNFFDIEFIQIRCRESLNLFLGHVVGMLERVNPIRSHHGFLISDKIPNFK